MNRVNSCRQGMVLIVAMWIVLSMAGMAIVFARSMRVELLAAKNRSAAAQAEWIARGALAAVVAYIDGKDGQTGYDLDMQVEAVGLGDGYFWILNHHARGELDLFGLVDESGKLNINYAEPDMLLRLPGMTDILAASTVDWRSPDLVSTAGGAKDEYYLLLSPPYYCKSGPFETVEELLLVKGAEMEILFGQDANRNLLWQGEKEIFSTDIGDMSNGRGIYDLITVHSTNANVLSADLLVDVNSSDTQLLAGLLGRSIEQSRLSAIMSRIALGRPFASLLDFFYRTELTFSEFQEIVSDLTTGASGRQAGLVNVNTAPEEVLLCLPGLEEDDVNALIARRRHPDTDLSNIAWVGDVLSPEKGVEAGRWMTVRSYQTSADIVAVSGDGRAFKRFYAVIDGRRSPPRVVCWQDLTGLGWPLSSEILINLRQGGMPENIANF